MNDRYKEWPELPLDEPEPGVKIDHATDLRVLINRATSFGYAADIVVAKWLEGGKIPGIEDRNVPDPLGRLGSGCCKYPDVRYAVARLYCHQMELLLKVAALSGRRLAGTGSKFLMTHKIHRLWRDAKDKIIASGVCSGSQIGDVEKSVLELAGLECSSMQFRYPRNSSKWDEILPAPHEIKAMVKPAVQVLHDAVYAMWERRHNQRLAR
ncbi:MAG: hypothetical protein NTU94_16525 [Planctomycetota bacterium]|nr:hypothetical protein [Planctomycetota bacterium]